MIEFIYEEDPKINYHRQFCCWEEKCEFNDLTYQYSRPADIFKQKCQRENGTYTNKSFLTTLNDPNRPMTYQGKYSNKTMTYNTIYQVKKFYEEQAQKHNINPV